MAIDGGDGGIEQSRHHPNAEESAHGTPATGANAVRAPTEQIQTIRRELASLLISTESLDTVVDLAVKLRDLESPRENSASKRIERATSEPITRAELENALEKTIENTIKRLQTSHASPPRSSWASIAAGAPLQSHGPLPWELRVVLPARHNREVTIRATAPDVLSRNIPDTVKAINNLLECEEAIAARRLPSGDVRITFKENATKYKGTDLWVTGAFGSGAMKAIREYTVVAKSLLTASLKDAHAAPEQLLEELRGSNEPQITKIKPMFSKEGLRCALLVSCNEVEAAKRLCNNGLIWRSEIFNCEPYSADVHVRQCYKCYNYGHIAKYCQKIARCGRCAGTAHEQGEATCPAIADPG